MATGARGLAPAAGDRGRAGARTGPGCCGRTWRAVPAGAGRSPGIWPSCSPAYAATRPGMVEAWSVGQDIDAAGRPLGADRAWQAELWRRLRVTVDQPGPAEQVATAVRELRAVPDSCDLPGRLSVFGATRLDPDHLAVLAALSAHRDVHLWLPHPSSALWAKVQAHLAGEDTTRSRRRADDRTEALVEHRLLAYLGRDARELQLTVAAAGAELVDQLGSTAGRGHSAAIARSAAARHRQRRGSAAGRGTVAAAAGRPQHRAARLPRAGPPGRGAARGAGGPAGRRSHPGTPGHRGDVPRHRDLRPAHRRGVRPGHRRGRGRAPRSPAAGPAGRPLAAPAQPAAGRGQPPGHPGRRPDAGLRAARPVRQRAGGAEVPVHRRRPRPVAGPGGQGRGALGPRRRAAVPVRPGRLRAEHLGRGPGPAAARGGHGRDRAAVHRHRPADGRRGLLRRRPGGTARRVRGPGPDADRRLPVARSR